MTDLKLRQAPALPALLNAADDRARKRHVEFLHRHQGWEPYFPHYQHHCLSQE